jgi:inosine-uridine nucleoside N-ribohydrolase
MKIASIGWVAVLPVLLLSPAVRLCAQALARVPVILDTDIGSDIDDAFALALLLASPEVELRGVTTVGKDTHTRALMVCRFLTMTGRRHTPVAAGAAPQPARPITGQYQYYYHPDVLFHRTTRPMKESAVEFLYGRLKAQPGRINLLATGPLTNIARLIEEKPACKPWIKRIVLAGGSHQTVRDGKRDAAPEANLKADVKAARAVFDSGVPLIVVPQSATAGLRLSKADLKKIFAPGTALSLQVQALYQLWNKDSPPLADVLAAALCFEERFCEYEKRGLRVDDRGSILPRKGARNARLVTAVKRAEFLKWYVGRMASCLPPARVPVKPLARGPMPHRVHVAEDFETDIERRWWMSGKPELKDLPPGSRRAVRGVLTHDFDDLLGNPKAMYTAVIFNPVPGPPMGKNTRLAFRYRLKGTDALRVQIYSLTNGYHRHLVLKGLPQDSWQEAAVDMTRARRPDGTGGPLSEGERIDDIQFYADPTAELLIDDIVLYDAAAKGEKRPFPKRIMFTGWFDSGRQGKEWPGDFEIAVGKGYFWHAARSVKNTETGAPWVRLHLRGRRPLGAATRLSFRYRLTGADGLRVVLINCTAKKEHTVNLTGLRQSAWAEATADFGLTRKGDQVDEIRFLLPKGAELLLDDVLLFEPN